MRILLVEDNPRVASFIRRGLREENYTTDLAPDGEQALFLAQTEGYDLIILDLLLPKRHGLEVLRTLRSEGVKVPVLILTAKDEVEDKVAGLDAGADDYVTKPFGFEELLARVRALLRRRSDILPAVLRVADLEVDTLRRHVTRAGKEIVLTNREYALLEFFICHPGQVLTRSLVAEQVWGYDFDTFSNVIDVHIARLRRKIDYPCSLKLLQTVRGSGYKLEAPRKE